eukprot:TRINITY_DN52534_c0_g1_i1.p1 TRINITY_DN52534_c0_g1~~TRINITY_DN52534_c0_g1_i1.p1  ORF type:complete len:502 (+),score=97.33 TRINITY_DN52534_c0_g1_i1:56-1561(+)
MAAPAASMPRPRGGASGTPRAASPPVPPSPPGASTGASLWMLDLSGDSALENSRRYLERILIAASLAASVGLAVAARSLPRHLQVSLGVNLCLAAIAFKLTTYTIGSMGSTFMKANLRGIDLNKRTTRRDKDGNLIRPIEGVAIPESQGTVCATVYILVLSVFIPFAFAAFDRRSIPLSHLCEYMAAVLTICFASFMGFMDDVLDLRWRHKIPLPFLSSLPLLFVYYANGKLTGVTIPRQMRGLLGEYIDLGPLFYVFLLLLACFSTHAINIYAGVNGLEAGQSVVIAASILALNITHLIRMTGFQETGEQHVQSLFLIIPFLGVACALLRLNWFPSKVFVGDTFCYFAGMTFAVCGIVGHYSKTLMLLLVPQMLNFLYSFPQLSRHIGIPCPRHRMPAFNSELGIVQNSYCELRPAALPRAGQAVFWALKTFKLADVRPAAEEGAVEMSNLTLINLMLYWFGPCREDILCFRLLMVQCLFSALCFWIRFGLSHAFYDTVQ